MILRIVLVSAVATGPSFAQDAPPIAPRSNVEYSPYPDVTFPNQVFFGDTHLHTAYSADAGLVGCTKTPDEAYRFAKGETIVSSTGVRARLKRPLDWLVVADHAENLGLPIAMAEGNEVLASTQFGREISEMAAPGTVEAMIASYEHWMARLNAVDDPLEETDFGSLMWQRLTEAAAMHDAPGSFTAFIGFEWTSGPNGNNLHRNVIFRDDKSLADQIVPISQYDPTDPEDLWKWMADYEAATGGRLLAIPHNGNISNGLMFDDVTLTTKEPIDADYAKRRMRWEPVYEVTQIKGDGETHPLLSPDDEFADYETWDLGSFGPEPKSEDMLPREYARAAYRRGLAYEAKLGVNPFKFGMIGSTDAHTGLSTAGEDNFFGKISGLEPSADPIRFEEAITGRFSDDPTARQTHAMASAAGIAGVWARENTREAIWDAFARKEVYATTGTRLRVRVFGGFGFVEKDLGRADMAAHGYERGVPMGGDVGPTGDDSPFTMLIRAVRDVDGANLDRLQVIKGWLDAEGETQERVYDVAVSDGRTIGADGRCRTAVGNTVDVEAATYTNGIGEPYLDAYWSDPDFDPAERAFYYVRVLEIPTPRWTTFDAKIFGVELPEGLPTSIQERAYTTPIWYTPAE
ncbi:MAG: DUF3604 domain-containing protein [Planctomycetota bacterium]